MALGIPLPGQPGDALLKGIDTGSAWLQRMLQPHLQRQQMGQEWQQHLNTLGIQKQQQQREAENVPFQRMLWEMQAKQAQANAAKAQAWTNLLNGGMNQNFEGMQQPQFGGMQYPQNNQMSAVSGEGMSNVPAQNMQIPQNFQQNNGQETILKPGNQQLWGMDKVAGIGPIPPVQTHYDSDGNLISRYPSGKVTSVRVSPGSQEIEKSKVMGNYQGKSYGDAVDTSMLLGEQKNNLQRLVDNLESYPNPDQVIGPINKYMTQFFGNPQDQMFLGDVMSTTGNIVLDAAKNIKGAFTGRDQSLINSLKPNANDPYWVFLGKLKGMGELTDLAQKRTEIYADLIHQNMAPHQAIKIAQEQTNFNSVDDKYKNLLKTAMQKSDLAQGKMPSFSDKDEAMKFLSGLSVEERLKLLKRAK